MNFMLDFCKGLGPIVKIVRTIIDLIRYGIPVLLVIFGMIDLGKAVMAGKEDEMKKAQSTLIKRVIYAVCVFLVVTVVVFIMNIVADSGAETSDDTWFNCFFGSESKKSNSAEAYD